MSHSASASIRSYLYTSFAAIERWFGVSKPLLTFLCYHSFSQDTWFFSTAPDKFEAQIKFLSKDYDFISMAEAEAHIFGQQRLVRPSIVITIDDGYQNIQNIQSICEKYAIKPTVFILAEPDKANRQELDNQKKFLTKLEINHLISLGWTFGSHTVTHPNLSKLTVKQQSEEIKDSKEILEKRFGFDCRWIAYPRGSYTSETIQLVQQAGYTLGFTTDYRFQITQDHAFEIPRIGVNTSHLPPELSAANARTSYFLRYLVATFLK